MKVRLFKLWSRHETEQSGFERDVIKEEADEIVSKLSYDRLKKWIRESYKLEEKIRRVKRKKWIIREDYNK